MPKLTPPEVTESNLRQAYDEAYYTHLRSLVRYTLGEKYGASRGASIALTGEMPDDIDLLPRYYEPGQSRQILSNETLMMAKVCYMDPDPSYPDLARSKEVPRKAFNKEVWKGRPYLGPDMDADAGEWGPEAHRMFIDGDGLGCGFVQIGIRDGWTVLQHHPLTRCIWDRHKLGITRARHVSFVHHLPEEEAVEMFGSKIKDQISESYANGLNVQPMRVAKLIQSFDMGLRKYNPTETWTLNTIGGPTLDISENKYGCLPFAHYQHVHLFGMRRPVGRIDFQIAGQDLRNGLERYMRLTLERGPAFDVADLNRLEPEDAEKLMNGELLSLLRLILPAGMKAEDVIHRYPAHELPLFLFELLAYQDRQSNTDGGSSDAGRGNLTQEKRTLGEVDLAQTGPNTQTQWAERQYAEFQARLWYKVNWIASRLHTAPTPLTIDGIPVLFNDPMEPRSSLSNFLSPASRPVVDEDSFQRQSPIRKVQFAQTKWTPFLADQVMNPIAIRREMLKDMGVKDPDRFLNPQAVQMMQGQPAGTMTDAMATGGMPQQAFPQGQPVAA